MPRTSPPTRAPPACPCPEPPACCAPAQPRPDRRGWAPPPAAACCSAAPPGRGYRSGGRRPGPREGSPRARRSPQPFVPGPPAWRFAPGPPSNGAPPPPPIAPPPPPGPRPSPPQRAAAPKMIQQVHEDETRQGEGREAQEAQGRHLEPFGLVEERHRVDPLGVAPVV